MVEKCDSFSRHFPPPPACHARVQGRSCPSSAQPVRPIQVWELGSGLEWSSKSTWLGWFLANQSPLIGTILGLSVGTNGPIWTDASTDHLDLSSRSQAVSCFSPACVQAISMKLPGSVCPARAISVPGPNLTCRPVLLGLT